MKKTILFLFTALLWSLPAAADRYTDMAQRQYEWMKAGLGDSICQHATPEVSAQLPAEAVSALWQQLTMQLGALQQEGEWSQTQVEGYTVCLRKLTFERGALQLNVALDDKLLLAGFHFMPADATAGAAGEEPDAKDVPQANE